MGVNPHDLKLKHFFNSKNQPLGPWAREDDPSDQKVPLDSEIRLYCDACHWKGATPAEQIRYDSNGTSHLSSLVNCTVSNREAFSHWLVLCRPTLYNHCKSPLLCCLDHTLWSKFEGLTNGVSSLFSGEIFKKTSPPETDAPTANSKPHRKAYKRIFECIPSQVNLQQFHAM